MENGWDYGGMAGRLNLDRRTKTIQVNGKSNVSRKSDQPAPGKYRQQLNGLKGCSGSGNACKGPAAANMGSSYSPGSKPHHKRKLILHMDVRNTVLVADSVWSVNVEEALNCYLSGVTWGRVDENGQWQSVSDEPSLRPPEPDAISYYKYVEQTTVGSSPCRAALRRLTGDFTQEPAGRRFLPHFRRLLKQLEWPHSEYSELLTMRGKDGKIYHYVIPAFLHLIRHLVRSGRRFGVVIRTFGMDAPQVLAAVKCMARGDHPSFPGAIPLTLHELPGKVLRFDDEKICLQRVGSGKAPGKPERPHPLLEGEAEIYDVMSATDGVLAYVDHFDYWSKQDFHYTAAKPIWIDESDQEVQHIFFDDNLRCSEENSIVDVRTFVNSARTAARSISLEECAKYEDACLVQADLLESIGNIDYFIQRIEVCEQKYDVILQESHRQRASNGTVM